jgi:hypothetical protein
VFIRVGVGGRNPHEMILSPPPQPLPTARKNSQEDGSGEAVLTSHDQQQAIEHATGDRGIKSSGIFLRR